MTTLDRLFKKNLLSREAEGRRLPLHSAIHPRRTAPRSRRRGLPAIAGRESGVVAAAFVSGGNSERARRAVARRSAPSGRGQAPRSCADARIARVTNPKTRTKPNVRRARHRRLVLCFRDGVLRPVAGRVPCWRTVRLHSQKHPVRRIADLLFALRMFPLLTAAVITAALHRAFFSAARAAARSTSRWAAFLWRSESAALVWDFRPRECGHRDPQASRTISTWTREAQPVETSSPVPVLRISRRFLP